MTGRTVPATTSQTQQPGADLSAIRAPLVALHGPARPPLAALPVTTVAAAPRSEPVHYSAAQHSLAWGLIAAAVVVAVLLSRRDPKPRRRPLSPRPPTYQEERQMCFDALEVEYRNRDHSINQQHLSGQLGYDEAHRAWRQSKLRFFDDLHDNGFPQPGHRRYR